MMAVLTSLKMTAQWTLVAFHWSEIHPAQQ